MAEDLKKDKALEEGLRAFNKDDQTAILAEAEAFVKADQVKGLGLAILTHDGKVRLAISVKNDSNIEMVGVLEMLKHKAAEAAFLPAPARGAPHAEPR